MLRFCSGLLLAAAAVAVGAATAPAPTEVVGTFNAALLEAMQHGNTLACEQRIERLAPVIRNTFEIPELARLVLRRHWNKLSTEQQRRFRAALEQMIVTTYASQFNRYNGESFGTPVQEELPAGRRKVHTTLNHPPDKPVSFDYILLSVHDGWRVINVLADGISDLALRSAQYDSVIKSRGFDALISNLRELAAKNRSQC